MSAKDRVTLWLEAFDTALTAKNVVAPVKFFDEDCYWRDLVSFTWNIKTCDGR